MKKLLCLLVSSMLVVVILMTACKKENDNKGLYRDYPSTAMVYYNVVTDIDGNQYDAVKIGNQVWMAENLRTTKYADGSTIPIGSTYSYTEPYLYIPGINSNNKRNMANVVRYGYLYNWPAVMHGVAGSEANPSGVQGICPDGWHVPSDAEWEELKNYVYVNEFYTDSCDEKHIAKTVTSSWGWAVTSDTSDISDTLAPGYHQRTNNYTGFSAFPAGINASGNNLFFGQRATFWSSTEISSNAYNFYIFYNETNLFRHDNSKCLGFSVRCIRN